MPLTKKGAKIKSAMAKEYGAEKGERVFYASENAGKIKGVHKGGGGGAPKGAFGGKRAPPFKKRGK